MSKGFVDAVLAQSYQPILVVIPRRI